MKKKLNQTTSLQLLDVVALLQDFPVENLNRGQVGTIVEELGENTYEVEFSDKKGRTITTLALNAEKLMLLKFEPESTV